MCRRTHGGGRWRCPAAYPGRRSRCPPRGQELGATKAEQRFSRESAAKKQNARGIFADQEDEGPLERTLRSPVFLGPSCHEPQVQVGHGEDRIEIDCRLIMFGSALEVADVLAGKRGEIVGTRVQLVMEQKLPTSCLGGLQVAGVEQESRAQQLSIWVGAGVV